MTDTHKPSPHAHLVFFIGALRELDRLADTLGEIHDETGLELPGHVIYYIGTRRKQLVVNIARLKGQNNQTESKTGSLSARTSA